MFHGTREHVSSRLRFDRFGWANHAGGLAALLVVLLAATSNDAALRWLGLRSWKNVQRTTCAFFVVTLGHAVLYRLIEHRRPSWVAIFVALTLATAARFSCSAFGASG